ncbi:hypothetical protein [Pseudomonas sp. GL-B-19]|nr:hypothetical protein [Pseudomonas sp. GL-B-19]
MTRKKYWSDGVLNSLRSVSISRRLWLILIVSVVMLMLKQLRV